MGNKLTNLDHLKDATIKAKGLTVQVAGAAAAAIEELERSKQDKITGTKGQVAGFDEQGNMIPRTLEAKDAGAATMEQVNSAIQEAILDSWEASY